MRTLSASRAAATIAFTSAEDIPIGFSHKTCLPALRAAIVHSACIVFGSGTYTASTFGSANNSAYEPYALSTPSESASFLADSNLRLPIATIRLRGVLSIAGPISTSVILADPKIPHLTSSDFISSPLLARLRSHGQTLDVHMRPIHEGFAMALDQSWKSFDS